MPDAWPGVPLADCYRLVGARLLPAESDQTVPYVGLEHLRTGQRHIDRFGALADVKSTVTPFEPGDVLFGRLRPYLRKVALASSHGVCSPEILVLRPISSQCLSGYLLALVSSEAVIERCVAASAGSRMPRTSASDLGCCRIPLPSLPEQKRIVDLMAALEEQRTGSQRLATSAAHLAGIVFEAVAGDFELVELGSVLDRIDAGRSPMTYGRPPRSGERGVLKVSAVQPGVYVPSESKAVSEDVVLDSRWEARAGDILMTRANTPERVGAVCRVVSTPPDLYLSDKTLRLLPTMQHVDPDFLVVAIGGRRARAQLSAGATGTSASMFNISQGKIRQVRIPLPPLELQRSIVAKVSAAQSTATAANAVTEAVERLRRSLLQELLSARHEIPPSYDRLFEAAS